MARPSFPTAWAAAQRIYSATTPDARVAQIVGGSVAVNIQNPDPKQRWKNTCAVRLSYILNHSGLLIPREPGQTVSGADKKQYYFRVKYLLNFLERCWGNAEVVDYPPVNALKGKKGVIIFEVTGWSDARGHATLYDGTSCYDHCYFNQPDATYRTDRANFWSLP